MNLIQDVLSAASTQPEQDHFARIKLADILPDPENFYETDGIEELAAAIDAFGLEQPLVVRPADEPGKFRLTGGHRRRLALLTLYAKDPERWAEVDVKITSSMGALADQARLICTNGFLQFDVVAYFCYFQDFTQFLVLPNGGENFILLFCHGKCPLCLQG